MSIETGVWGYDPRWIRHEASFDASKAVTKVWFDDNADFVPPPPQDPNGPLRRLVRFLFSLLF